MSAPQNSSEHIASLLRQLDVAHVLHQSDIERIATRIAVWVRVREVIAIEEAAQTFEDEYCNHDDPLIGTIRGLKAIRALARERSESGPE